MKHRYLILLIALMVIVGCGGGSNGGSKSSFDTSNNAPVINDISTNTDNYSVEQNETDIVAYVKENTREAFKIEATDKSTITYSLSGDDFGLFDIDSISGDIFFREATDYERKPTYKFKVVITDGIGNRTTKNVHIYVRDSKQEPPTIISTNRDTPLDNIEESRYFITLWKTDNNGISNSNQITIPTLGDGYNYSVDWGDGTSSQKLTSDATHTYTIKGEYRVKISGEFPRIVFGKNSTYDNNDKINIFDKSDNKKLLSIEQWGDIKWLSMRASFSGCSNLIINASKNPNLSNVKNMSFMFAQAISLNQDINNWDTSNVTNMSALFQNATKFNQNVGEWDVSNVTNMSWLFKNSKNFNQDIGNWNTSSVISMQNMFNGATRFNQDIGNWNTSNVTSFYSLFNRATDFNQDISNWDTSKVTSMYATFEYATAFNQNIGGWIVSSVTNMNFMFNQAKNFNQEINNWDVSAVTGMQSMFRNAIIFNKNIGSWNLSNVTITSYMFEDALNFNQDISTWNVSNVSNMYGMFAKASSFNQNLNGWSVSNLTNTSFMFYQTTSLAERPSWYKENLNN